MVMLRGYENLKISYVWLEQYFNVGKGKCEPLGFEVDDFQQRDFLTFLDGQASSNKDDTQCLQKMVNTSRRVFGVDRPNHLVDS